MTPEPSRNTLSKNERLCSKNDISMLLARGKFAKMDPMSYCFRANDAGYSRIMISVSKKFFKRAVKRNLLKRRIREAYRLQKTLLAGKGYDILFIYRTKEILTSAQLHAAVGQILERIKNQDEAE